MKINHTVNSAVLLSVLNVVAGYQATFLQGVTYTPECDFVGTTMDLHGDLEGVSVSIVATQWGIGAGVSDSRAIRKWVRDPNHEDPCPKSKFEHIGLQDLAAYLRDLVKG